MRRRTPSLLAAAVLIWAVAGSPRPATALSLGLDSLLESVNSLTESLLGTGEPEQPATPGSGTEGGRGSNSTWGAGLTDGASAATSSVDEIVGWLEELVAGEVPCDQGGPGCDNPPGQGTNPEPSGTPPVNGEAPSPGLTVEKTASAQAVTPGSTVTFTIT